MSRPALRALWLLVPFLAACGGGASTGKCGSKSCPSGQACETATGLCKATSPAADAGTDAGTGGGSGGGTGGGTGGGAGGGTGGGTGPGCTPACASGLVCNAPVRACVECLSASDCKDAARPACDAAAHVCTAAEVKAGESCTDAQDINAAAATGAAVPFTLVGATSDEPAGTCGNDGTPERVFTFTTVVEKDAFIQVETDGGTSWDPVLRVVEADCATGAELSCEDNGGMDGPESWTVPRLPPGTYFVTVDAFDPAELGAGELRVQLTDPKPAPANDACANPAVLALPPVGSSSSVAGDTAGAANDNDPAGDAPSCASGAAQDGLDVVYTFSVTQPVGVRFTATPAAGSPLQAVLYLRGAACEDADVAAELGCAYDITSSTGAAELTVPSLAPGTYHLWVDGADVQAGAFALGVEVFTPPQQVDGTTTEACTTPPQDLVLAPAASGHSASILLDTTNATDDEEPATYAGLQFGGRDAVFRLALTSVAQVTVKVTPSSSTVDPVIYVREGAPASTVADTCTAASAAATSAMTDLAFMDTGFGGEVEELQFQPQAGMEYFLFVDSIDDLSAGMQLVEITQP